MREPSGFQLSGSAPDLYERYIVATLTATSPRDRDPGRAHAREQVSMWPVVPV